MKYDKDDIMVERMFPSGGWNISYRTPEDELIKMKYLDFTREEALEDFEALLKSK